MTNVGRTIASVAILAAASATTVVLAWVAGSGNFPLGFVNRDFTSPLLLQLGLSWVAAILALTGVIAAVRIGRSGGVVARRAARGVGLALVILVVLWMLLLGFLSMIGGGAVLAPLITLAATGPMLLLAAGVFAQGAVRNAWVALVPPLSVLLVSGTATAFGLVVGLSG